MTTPPPMPSSPSGPPAHPSVRTPQSSPERLKKVRLWIILNLGAFPGLGTVLAGRKEGYFQAAWMVAGFVAFVVGIYRWGKYQTDMIMGNAHLGDGQEPGLQMVWWGLAGAAFAWLWSAWSSWKMWSEAKN